MNNDDKTIKALISGTKRKKINWNATSSRSFKSAGEKIEKAYYFTDDSNDRDLIVYKSVITDTNYYGDEVDKVNIVLAVARDLSSKADYKIADYELDDSSLLWTLFKIVERNVSKIDSYFNNLVDKYGDSDDDDDLPF